ncbi:uncharacterized protein [Amphiura filiformis]|uniref:uncharacterized protein n=1 Tax=Amphiura filiformis TaxID=82378 RepID=UPI003B227780
MAANSFTMQSPAGNPFNTSGPSPFHINTQPLSSSYGVSSTSAVSGLGGQQMNEEVLCSMKRRRVEEEAMEGSPLRQCQCGQSAEVTAYRGRRFVPVSGCDKLYHSQNVKPKGETMYVPMPDDILINMNNIEQVSFGKGVFFLGDISGNYVKTDQGHIINLWRYDTPNRQLYISRSLLFLDIMLFNEVKGMLQCM